MSQSSLFSQSIPNNYRTVSGIVTPSQDDTVLYCDTSSAAVVINLLAIPNNYWNTNAKLYIVDVSGNASVNNITVNAGTGQTIDNLSSVSIAANGGSLCVRVSGNTKYSSIGGSTVVPSVTIPVYNTVYVMKNGSDTTGLVERFDKPFLTIGAARTAALAYFTSRTQNARVKIVVESGSYSGIIYIDDFIDYDLGNSIITGSTSLIPTIYAPNTTTYTATTNGVPNCIIYGSATIINTFANTACLENQGTNCTLVINCNSLIGELYEAVLIRTGNTLIYANDIHCNLDGATPSNAFRQCINIATNNSYAQLPVLEIHNAKIYTLQAGSINSVIELYNGEDGGNLQVGYSKLTLVNCQLGNWATARAAIELPHPSSGTASSRGYCDIVLIDTIIYSNAAFSADTGSVSDYFTTSDRGAINLYTYSSYANRVTSITNPTGGVYIGTILVDSNVKFNNGVTI